MQAYGGMGVKMTSAGEATGGGRGGGGEERGYLSLISRGWLKPWLHVSLHSQRDGFYCIQKYSFIIALYVYHS